jgi:hypothetical protein
MTEQRSDASEPEFEFSFDCRPPYRIEERNDGSIWVEGDGVLLEMDSVEQAQAFIEHLLEDRDEALTEYLIWHSRPG